MFRWKEQQTIGTDSVGVERKYPGSGSKGNLQKECNL